MELGVSGTIRTKAFGTDQFIDNQINKWLDDNPDVEVLDIKFASSAMDGCFATDALIIYKK